MTVSFAVIGDLHLDRPFRWAGPEAGRKLRAALTTAFANAVSIAIEENVDAFLLAGDIYEHEHQAPDTGAFMSNELARLGDTPVFIVAGNHDHLAPDSIWQKTEWPQNVTIFPADRWESSQIADGFRLWGISHGKPSNTPNLLPDLHTESGEVHLALFHGSLHTGGDFDRATAHAPFEENDIEAAGLSHAFVGHYHRPSNDTLLSYPGSPATLDFGARPSKGVLLADVDTTGTVSARWREVAAHRLLDLDLNVTGCSSKNEIIQRLHALLTDHADKEFAVRVTVNGTLDPDVDLKLADLEGSALTALAAVVRKGDLAPGYDLDEISNEATVRGEFVLSVLNSDLDEELKWAVVTTGLRALDGRNDLEVI